MKYSHGFANRTSRTGRLPKGHPARQSRAKQLRAARARMRRR